MNLKIVKFLLLSALFCSATVVVTMIATDLYAVHPCGDPIGGGHPCGDPIGGGHPCGDPIGGGHPL